ncbi:MAG: hypothetical protein MZV65_22425 [Chromatiales bacterium]|nr:hypothetical protein [Chromatiales bacterium]
MILLNGAAFYGEKAAIARARLSTFTTQGAVALYQQRYPQYAARLRVIENGYDDDLPMSDLAAPPLNPGKLTLLHSGIVYPSERDPTHLMQALAKLKRQWPDGFSASCHPIPRPGP